MTKKDKKKKMKKHNIGYETLAANIWRDTILMFELQTIMRQKEDQAFAALLNRIREGNHI